MITQDSEKKLDHYYDCMSCVTGVTGITGISFFTQDIIFDLPQEFRHSSE